MAMTHRKFQMLKKTLITLLLLGLSLPVLAKDTVYTSVFNNRAISGYDAVSYFSDAGPVKGSKKFKTRYMNAEWRFASQENLDAFLQAPEKFAPQYGGYCAWAVSEGYTAKGDPKQWNIHNDKLYLNYNADIKLKWEADMANHIERGNINWPNVLEK